MKKSILLMAGLIGLALTSCDDKSDLGTQQKNEAPVVIPVDGVAVNPQFKVSGSTLDLSSNTEFEISVATVTIGDKFKSDAGATAVMEVANNPEFNGAVVMPIYYRDLDEVDQVGADALSMPAMKSVNCYVVSSDWENAFLSLYDVDPRTLPNYVRMSFNLTEDTQNTVLYYDSAAGEEWWPTMLVEVTPVDQELDLSSAYNFVYTVNGTETTLQMDHSDKHYYVDPTFAAMIEVTEDDLAAGDVSWTVVDATDASKVYGVTTITETDDEGNETVKNMLELISEGAEPGLISKADKYKINVNMLDFSYSVVPISFFYVPSTGNQYKFTNNWLSTTDGNVYSGYVGLSGVFTIRTAPSTNEGIGYGAGESEGTLAIDGPAINISSKSLYMLEANILNMSWKATPITSIGIIGDFEDNSWGSNVAELAQTKSNDYWTWTGEMTTTKADTEWKFRMNGEWVYNLGGTEEELTQNGPNIVTADPGTYTVTLDLSTIPYKFTIEPKE